MATVRCPSCDDALDVLDEHRDWTVRCPRCAAEFVPNDLAPARPPRRRPNPEEDADGRPRRPGRRPDPDDGEDDYDRDDRARQTVAAPATWLEVLGWLGVVGSLGTLVLCAVGAAVAADNNGNDEDAIPLLLIGGCVGVFGIPYSAAMAVGARRMRDLSSRGWAMAACMLAIGSFSLCGVLGFVHAAFGVWALVALDKPEVRAAFGLAARDRPRRRRDDWD